MKKALMCMVLLVASGVRVRAQSKVTPYQSEQQCKAANTDGKFSDYGCVAVKGGWEWEQKNPILFWTSARPANIEPIVAPREEAVAIEIYRATGETLVAISRDGKITFGKNYKPDEAARIFWKAIGAAAPCRAEREKRRP